MSKKYLHKAPQFTALLCAIMLLLTTNGFSLYSHHCKKHNTTSYSILLPNKACACHENNSEEPYATNTSACCTTQKSDCCTDREQFSKLDIQSFLNTSFSSAPILVFINTILHHINQDLSKPIIDFNVLWQSVCEPPPPKSTIQLLSIIQVYLN